MPNRPPDEAPAVPVAIVSLPESAAEARPAAHGMQNQAIDPSKPAETTYQEDLVTAGQRKTSLIWEYTQAAVAIVFSCSYAASEMLGIDATGLANATFLIVGFYFSRTNHIAIGGVGKKPHTPYTGR